MDLTLASSEDLTLPSSVDLTISSSEDLTLASNYEDLEENKNINCSFFRAALIQVTQRVKSVCEIWKVKFYTIFNV